MADVMSRIAQIPIRQSNNDFMAMPATTGPGFQVNKESEWSRVCDNVFDNFVADDDVFGLGPWQHERSSSDESAGGIYGYSMSSGQSNQTTGTSPDPTWLEQVAVTAAALDNPMDIHPSLFAVENECAVLDTPATSPTRHTANNGLDVPTSVKSSKPQSFWAKAVSRIEQGAKISSKKDRLRASKSHPDFLSLGGHPSPATVPCPVPQVPIVPVPASILSVPRSRGREPATGRKQSTSQLRSISRGRPQGVAKSGGANGTINNGNASARKASLSPVKMMNPSRYRSGYQEALVEQLSDSPSKAARLVQHHQSLPPPPPPPPVQLQQQLQQRHHQQRSSFPASPPSSAQFTQQDFAAFGASPMHAPAPAFLNHYDTELSPLTSTFQQARLHTPDASPFFGQTSSAANSYFDHNGAFTSNYPTHAVSLDDVQPLSQDRMPFVGVDRVGSFDFGFNNTPATEAWPATTYDQPSTAALHALNPQDVFTGVHQPTLQQLETNGNATGLGITCDTTVFCPQTAAPQDYTTIPDAIYSNLQAVPPGMKACYPPMPQHNGMPTTPHKQMMGAGLGGESPSPPMTDSHIRRASGGSRIRRVSKHRRTKSATSVPRAQNADRGGFVNFTPDDSGKILSGVAPSGSSKTKARREKEAADKRRRLSQAAIKAVLDAGGDAEDLVKAGFDV